MGKLCERESCFEGNCPGCKDGQRWCQDPRCEPYCVGCQPPKQNFEVVNILFATFLFVLLLGVLISLFFYGPKFIVHHKGSYDSNAKIEPGPMIF